MYNFQESIVVILLCLFTVGVQAQRIQQKTEHGVVAVNRSGSTIRSVTSSGGTGSLISWRKLAEEPEGTTYNVYKRAKGTTSYSKINASPLTVTCLQTALADNTEYAVTAVSPDGVEGEKSKPFLYKTQAYQMFGKSDVVRWIKSGKLYPCRISPGKKRYKLVDLQKLASIQQNYLL